MCGGSFRKQAPTEVNICSLSLLAKLVTLFFRKVMPSSPPPASLRICCPSNKQDDPRHRCFLADGYEDTRAGAPIKVEQKLSRGQKSQQDCHHMSPFPTKEKKQKFSWPNNMLIYRQLFPLALPQENAWQKAQKIRRHNTTPRPTNVRCRRGRPHLF